MSYQILNSWRRTQSCQTGLRASHSLQTGKRTRKLNAIMPPGGDNALNLKQILLGYPGHGTGKHSAKNREDFSNEHGRMRAFEPAAIRVLGKCRRHLAWLDGLSAVRIAKEGEASLLRRSPISDLFWLPRHSKCRINFRVKVGRRKRTDPSIGAQPLGRIRASC